jgi:hypothetical protein
MLTRHLLTISLFVPLVAVSATAQAASTISDKSYWPSEARQSTPLGIGQRADINSAFAYDRTTSRFEPAITAIVGSSPRYQGGPKGR